MPSRRSPAALIQYALVVALVLVLAFLLARGVSAVVFTLVFLLGVALVALPGILAGPSRSPKAPPQAQIAQEPAQQRAASEEPGEVSYSVRPLDPDDLLETASILRKSFEEYRSVLDPPTGAHRENAESLRIVLKDSKALVAVVSESNDGVTRERIAGCVFYQFVIDHVYLFRLAVLPEYRRRGIASNLIEQVEAITREAGVRRVQLGVRTALPGNQAYYERRGYRVLRYETHKDYPTPTVVILEKQV